MKVLFFILVACLLSACGENTSATKVEPTPTNINSNQITVVNIKPLSKEESDAIDKAKQKEIEIEREKLKNVPEELVNFDFGNFSYQTKWQGKIRLKDGGYENREGMGGVTINLNDIYYTDLTGDGIKEAIVNLFSVQCGGSCDGGSDLFFVYTVRQKKLKLIWQFETGSRAYGCSAKSFTVKDRQIILEIFGKCDIKENDLVRNEEFKPTFDKNGALEMPLSKFESKGASHYIFGFNGSRIVPLSKTLIDTPKTSASNYRTEVKIID